MTEIMEKIVVFTDGGARGNPGPAGIGVAIYDDRGNLLSTHKKYIGETTNNQAEYRAVIMALEKAAELGVARIEFWLDSELVVKQLRGEYKVKNEQLAPLVRDVFRLSRQFATISYNHVPREKNKLADKLVNQAIDEYQSK